MRRLAVVALVWFAVGARAVAGPADEVVPYDGIVPGADSTSAVAVLVVDGETGRPVPGATLRWYPERCTDGVGRYDVLLAEGVADALGVARVPAASRPEDAHWVAEHPGYAPSHEYGARPPPRMALWRGAAATGRVVDLLGRPVAGVPVEAYLGCGHGPTVAAATTDPQGRFALPPLPRDTTLWVVAPGYAAFKQEVGDPDGFLGAGGLALTLRPAATVRGRVLDAAGRALGGVVVRAFAHSRGPVATTAADGTFVLAGFDASGGLRFVHPVTQAALNVPDVDPSRPLVVRLAGVGPALPRADATVRVRVRFEDGAPVPAHPVALVGEDGLAWIGTTGDGDAEAWTSADGATDPAAARWGGTAIDVPAGTYDVRTAVGLWSSYEVVPTRVTVEAGGHRELTVVARLRPRLVVEGAGPVSVHAADGTSREVDDEQRVPADAHLVVVGALGARAEVGPVGADGVRRARLVAPPRHRVRWPASFPVDSAGLTWRGIAVEAELDGDSLVTPASGDLSLLLEHAGDAPLAVPVTLPALDAGAVVVDADLAAARVADDGASARVRVRLADGSLPGAVDVDASDGHASWSSSAAAHDEEELGFVTRGTVWASKEGYVTRAARVEGPGVVEVRFGSGRLDLTVVGDDGAALDADVMLDGERYGADAGRLRLEGLPAGEHVALVGARDVPERAVVWRFSSAEGETVTRTVSVDPGSPPR